ncbi:hypothetical protein CRYUN_Cryun03dG0074600 [Craigia yunnanensis]
MGKREGSGSGNLKLARPIVAEKLWDGSLQLNSSVTVSVVAFFKSGEKMTDIKWSELVEVKGKVRLEAFEKYIQELARSRNRGLMVVSLCWKEGSSKSGLAGLKEIAKGYKKGERVGFAQLSPGSSSPGHSSPWFPSLASELPFSTQRSSYANHCPITASVKPAQPRQTDRYIRGAPSSLMGSNSSHLWRPPVHPPGWRGGGR